MAKQGLMIPLVAVLLGGVACSHMSDSQLKREIASNGDGRGARGERSRFYDGPDIGPGRDVGRRNPGMSNLCEKYRNASGRHVLACTFGIEEGNRLAERIAGGHGRVEGYQRGYVWGFRKGVDVMDDDPNAIAQGGQSVDQYASYLQNATNSGESSGVNDGKSMGASEARGRYYSAVGTNKFPSNQVSVPTTNYAGETGASARFIGGVPTVEDILRAKPEIGEIGIYRDLDRNDNDYQDRRAGDIWNRDGIYRHEVDRYLDANAALQTFLRRRSPSLERYMNLNSPQRVGHTNPAPNPVPNPVPNPAPNPQPTPVVPPAPVDFQEIFKSAFLDAYSRIAPFQYYRAFNENIDNGQNDGQDRGEQIGRIMAFKKGLIIAFDRKYQSLSLSAYRNSFSQSYMDSFVKTYDFYKTNPVLTLNFTDVFGQTDDGVTQPGENFGVVFDVTNAGGVGANLAYTVSGDVDQVKNFSDSVAPLSKKVIRQDVIGRIDPRLDNNSRASIQLRVNDMNETLREEIMRPIQIDDVTKKISVIDGAGTYTVILSNISTVPLTGKISIELKADGQLLKTVVGEKMTPGQKQSFAVDFKGLDPLKWMKAYVNMEILVKYNDTVYLRSTDSTGGTINTGMVAAYFDRLVNEVGFVPEGINKGIRLTEIRNILLANNRDDVAKRKPGMTNYYRDNGAETVPGIILAAKQARGNQTPKALAEYLSLAKEMAPEAKRFDSFLGIHPKRDYYLKILTSIAGKEIR